MKKLILAVIAALAISPMASALPLTKTAPNAYTGDLINETGLAHSTSFTLDIGQYAANRISAVMTYSTNSFAAGTFTSGNQSTGTITVLSTTALSGVTLTIAGQVFTAGVDFPIVDSTTGTANNMAQAMNASTSPVYGVLVSTANNGRIIFTTSTYVGGNFAMVSSNASKILVSSTNMEGGTGAYYSATTDIILIPSHGFTPGLPVLYTTGTVAISGLTNATTYYASVIDADHIYLATTSALAVAGIYHVDITVQLASATSRTYTLTPLKMEDSTSVLTWQVSNDNSQYFTILSTQNPTVTIASTTAAGYSYWDFGNVDFRYLRQLVTGPSTGGVVLRTIVHAKNAN